MKTSSQLSPGNFIIFMLLHAVLLLAILAAGRSLLVANFALPGELAGCGREILAMWTLGLRYDVRAATIALLPLFFLGLVSCFYGGSARVFDRLQKIYSPFIYLVFSLATVINFFYYSTFQKEINVMVFNLKDDDTGAVLSSVMNDYPFIRAMLLVLGVTLICTWLTRRLWRVCRGISWGAFLHPVMKAALLLCFTALSFMGARGTLHHIPLRQRDRFVSKIPILNNAMPNALLALQWALADYMDNPTYQPVSIEEGHQLANRAIGREDLMEKTPDNPHLAKNPPHVVMVVREGFGSNLLEFDRPDTVDLLGSFRPHMDEDFVFRRFLAENFRTVAALTRTLFYCPDMNVTRGLFKTVRLDNSVFDVYKQNGHETVFIHAGLPSWWDMRLYMSAQKVDHSYFSDDFLERHKKAKLSIASGSWGLPDEYAYPMALELLEKSSKPMFIVIMTLSNHSPFDMPPGYKDRFPITPGREVLDSFSEGERAARKILSCYQYVNNCAGDFIAAVKSSPLGKRTVIGITGDHASVQIKAKYPDVLFLNKATPFYLYVPKPILEHTAHTYVPERVGSHKDIIPTLYSLSLSNAPYYSVGGRNMLAEQDDPARAFGYNICLFMDTNGVCAIGPDFSNAWHSWGERWSLKPDSETIPMPVAEKILAYEELYRWQINARIAGVK
jgi:phosphoglycerol transferase MdoB-like AlkP superfamily enzyme